MLPTIPSANKAFFCWNSFIAAFVFGPDCPSTGPGLKPLFTRNCWTSSTELIMIAELSLGTQESFPAFGFETAVSATFSTSPPEGSQELLNGEELNKSLETRDLPTSLSII